MLIDLLLKGAAISRKLVAHLLALLLDPRALTPGNQLLMEIGSTLMRCPSSSKGIVKDWPSATWAVPT